MDKVYHVTRAIVRKREVVLLHDKHKSVMVLTSDGDKFRMSEPDGEERLDWLLRFGAMTNEEVEAEAATLPEVRKRKLIERIQAQLEAK